MAFFTDLNENTIATIDMIGKINEKSKPPQVEDSPLLGLPPNIAIVQNIRIEEKNNPNNPYINRKIALIYNRILEVAIRYNKHSRPNTPNIPANVIKNPSTLFTPLF